MRSGRLVFKGLWSTCAKGGKKRLSAAFLDFLFSIFFGEKPLLRAFSGHQQREDTYMHLPKEGFTDLPHPYKEGFTDLLQPYMHLPRY
jgi:hypothetical protein